MPMSQQEATDLVIGELAKRRDRNDIIRALCAKTGGSREQIERFVQSVESSRPPVTAPTSPPAPAVPMARPTPPPASVKPVRLPATGSAQAAVQPLARPVESGRPIIPAPAATVAAAPKPTLSTPPPPPPVTADKGDALNTPENIAFVIKEVAGSRHRNDIIMALCEKTGSSWDQVQRFVQRVESENRQAITARQSPLLIMIGVGTIIVGLVVVAYYGFRTLTGTIYIFLNMPIPYLGNAVYIGTGLAMMAGGTVGVLRTARNLITK